MSALRPLVISGVTTVVALGVVLALPGVRRKLFAEREVLEFEEVDEAAMRRDADPDRPAPIDALGRYRLDEATVRAVQPLRGKIQVYDPFCYMRMRAELDRPIDWPEHEDRGFRIVTNSLGLRQDDELVELPLDRRVLVVGDSHVTGVCNNAETLAARLELELMARAPGETVQVANGANGAFGFFHYLGVLERFLDLGWKPDVLVVVVYGGNDFSGLELWHLFHGTRLAPISPEAKAARSKMRGELAAAFGQALHSAEYLAREGGAEVETAARMAREVTAEIQRLCAAERIELLVAYLPPAAELEGQVEGDVIERGLALLGLERADLERVARLGDRYLADIEELGVATLDLRPGFRTSEAKLYWRADQHLNVAGQALAAKLVAAQLAGESR